jgi:hypothetical protein
MVLTSLPYGIKTYVAPNDLTVKTAAYTVVANTDCGKTFSVSEAVTFTLPAIASGQVYTFINEAEDGLTALTISPNAADGIMYKGDSTDDKDLINTAATHKKGDTVVIANVAGTDYWSVIKATGVWNKEA